jgi:tetratricopeptide (TPR) repeat protein
LNWINQIQNPDSLSAWQKFLLEGLPYTLEECKQIAGTFYLRKGHFYRALELFRQIPQQQWQTWKDTQEDSLDIGGQNFMTLRATVENPFRPGVKYREYNKLTFTQEITRLLSLARQGEEAKYYFQAANLLRSNRYWSYQDRIWRGWGHFFCIDQMSPKHMLVRSLAAHYYFRATQTAQDPELKAESLYLLARIIDRDALGEIANDVYLQFVKKYHRSRFYAELNPNPFCIGCY